MGWQYSQVVVYSQGLAYTDVYTGGLFGRRTDLLGDRVRVMADGSTSRSSTTGVRSRTSASGQTSRTTLGSSSQGRTSAP